MTNTVEMNASRACARCGKELTDAASMECGVGPVCRKMDNALLAKVIPANPAVAKAAWSKISIVLMPPATVHTMTMVDAKVATMSDVDDDTFGTDWRETVKRIEWVLSHAVGGTVTRALYDFVNGLGYAGLVSMWKGEAASGCATITFESNRLYLAGPKNSAGKDALKAIPGRLFHAKSPYAPKKSDKPEDKARWSVPANQVAAFESAVLKHWPNNSGLAEACAAARAVAFPTVSATTSIEWEEVKGQVGDTSMTLPGIGTVVVPAPTPAKPEPKCWVTVDGDHLSVRTPYSGQFVAKLKTLFYKDRAWNKVAQCWTVKATHKDFVLALIQECYGETVSC